MPISIHTQASCLWWLEHGMSQFVEMKSQGV
jgi:hypothetical protein